MLFILFSYSGNGGFNFLSRGGSPSENAPNNSNHCCLSLIMVIQVCVLPAFFFVIHCQHTMDKFNLE